MRKKLSQGARARGRLHIKKQIRYDTGMAFNVNPGLQAMMNELKEIKELLRELVPDEDTP